MMFGALQVFLVVIALDLLDLGDGGVGYLGAAMGVGAFLGAFGAFSLTGVRRLSPAFLIGLAVRRSRSSAIGLWSTTARGDCRSRRARRRQLASSTSQG